LGCPRQPAILAGKPSSKVRARAALPASLHRRFVPAPPCRQGSFGETGLGRLAGKAPFSWDEKQGLAGKEFPA